MEKTDDEKKSDSIYEFNQKETIKLKISIIRYLAFTILGLMTLLLSLLILPGTGFINGTDNDLYKYRSIFEIMFL